MNNEYLDPQRGRSEKPGVISRILRLIGMITFLTGIAMGCYAGLQWLQTGHSNATVIYEALGPQLSESARAWIARPRSWFGLQRLVLWVIDIPVFASVAFIGFLILLTSTASPRKYRA